MLIAAPSVLTAESEADPVPGNWVFVDGGTIAQVGRGTAPGTADVELPDGVLVPGLVDVQINGYYGVEFQLADADSWDSVAQRLPETGTTAFMPTMITAPVGEISTALRRAAAFVPDLARGARVLGVHVEGPFISPIRRGAHNPQWIVDPTRAAVTELIEAGRGLLRVVTLAPELPGALSAIEQFTDA